jgi:hypothetical protein
MKEEEYEVGMSRHSIHKVVLNVNSVKEAILQARVVKKPRKEALWVCLHCYLVFVAVVLTCTNI